MVEQVALEFAVLVVKVYGGVVYVQALRARVSETVPHSRPVE